MAIALHYDHRIHAVVQYMDLPAVKQMAFTFVGTSASTGKLHVLFERAYFLLHDSSVVCVQVCVSFSCVITSATLEILH